MSHGSYSAISLACLAGLVLGGCAGPIAGALTIAGALSTVTTGKGLYEQALSAATGKDCNVLGSVMNPDRDLCEEPGAAVTKGEFRGIFGGDDENKPVPARKPVLVRLNGELVYTMAPVTKPADIANAEVVRALPPVAGAPTRGEDETEPHPTLVRVKGKLIYTMSPISRARDIHSNGTPAATNPEPQPPRQP